MFFKNVFLFQKTLKSITRTKTLAVLLVWPGGNFFLFKIGWWWSGGEFTWIAGCERCCLSEITVPWILARRLIEQVHGISSMWCNGVWFKTSATRLNWGAVDALAASIVKICLQLSIRNTSLGHTPDRTSCWVWWWIHWSFRGWWGLGGKHKESMSFTKCMILHQNDINNGRKKNAFGIQGFRIQHS